MSFAAEPLTESQPGVACQKAKNSRIYRQKITLRTFCVSINSWPNAVVVCRQASCDFLAKSYGEHRLSSLKSLPRERIIASGRQLFAERGFHQTSMADLAHDADVSVGALYRSFESKAAIIEAIVFDDTGEMLAELKGEVEAVVEGRANAEATIVRIFRERMVTKVDALEQEIMAEAYRNSSIADAITNFCGDYRNLFGDLANLACPTLTPAQKAETSEILMAFYFGLRHRRFFGTGLNKAGAGEAIAAYLHKFLHASEYGGQGCGCLSR